MNIEVKFHPPLFQTMLAVSVVQIPSMPLKMSEIKHLSLEHKYSYSDGEQNKYRLHKFSATIDISAPCCYSNYIPLLCFNSQYMKYPCKNGDQLQVAAKGELLNGLSK